MCVYVCMHVLSLLIPYYIDRCFIILFFDSLLISPFYFPSAGRLARFFSSLRKKKTSPSPIKEVVDGGEKQVADNTIGSLQGNTQFSMYYIKLILV